MSGKRSDMKISSDILKVTLNGAKKSHIVYKANLNFQLGKKYMDHLMSCGLIRGPSDLDKTFYTTARGVEFIKYFEGLKEFLGPENTVAKSREV